MYATTCLSDGWEAGAGESEACALTDQIKAIVAAIVKRFIVALL
jgi:hypothetical protein